MSLPVLLLAASIVFLQARGVAAGNAAANKQLLQDLELIRTRNNVPAMGLVIVRGNKVVLLETRGIVNRESEKPITDTAIFRIGSISKMFTGLAAAELQARALLDLQRPVKSFELQGTYSNAWLATQPINTAQLLEHSAGFHDLVKAEWDYSDPRQLPLDTTLRLYPQARKTQWQPGLHHSYSNGSVGLAGLVLEQASGQTYETLMEKLVFAPLKLTDTSVLPPPTQRLPRGYDSDGRTAIPYWHQIFRPFAAINTSLQDMAVFLRMLIARGELAGKVVFSPQTIARVETPTTTLAARAGLNFGYGLGNYTWLHSGILFHGHGGDADGYLSKLGYTYANSSGYFLVITAFQNDTLRAMQAVLEDYLVGDLEAAPPPVPLPLETAVKHRITGNYERASWRFPGARPTGDSAKLRIFESQNTLYSQLGNARPRQLIAVSRTLFRRAADNRATVFAGSENQHTYFQEDGDNFRKIAASANQQSHQ